MKKTLSLLMMFAFFGGWAQQGPKNTPQSKTQAKKANFRVQVFKKTDTSSLEALSVSLTKGEAYLWCACRISKTSLFAMARIMEPSLNHKNLL